MKDEQNESFMNIKKLIMQMDNIISNKITTTRNL